MKLFTLGRFAFVSALLTVSLYVPHLAAANTVVQNGSFEKDTNWNCLNCTDAQTAADLFLESTTSYDGDRLAAFFTDTLGIKQTVDLFAKKARPGIVELAYLTDGSFTVALRNSQTNDLFVKKEVTATKKSANQWQILQIKLPTDAYDKSAVLSIANQSGVTAIDAVTIRRRAYPVAQVTVYDSTTKAVIPSAKVWFKTSDGDRVKLQKEKTGEVVTSVQTNADGVTPIVSVHGKPKQVQLCAQVEGGTKRCSAAYDKDYFAYDKRAAFSFYL